MTEMKAHVCCNRVLVSSGCRGIDNATPCFRTNTNLLCGAFMRATAKYCARVSVGSASVCMRVMAGGWARVREAAREE